MKINQRALRTIRQEQVLTLKPSLGRHQHSPRILRIVRRLLDDVDPAKIAQEFGVSRNYVYYVQMEAETAGLLAALKRRMPLAQRRERIARILEMEQSNIPVRLIARKLGVDKTWVYRVCRKYRVNTRRRPLAERPPQVMIEIIADLLNGVPRTQIARQRQVSVADVVLIRVRAAKAGVIFHSSGGLSYHRKISREIREYITRLVPLLSAEEIARVFDLSVTTVRRTARRSGTTCLLAKKQSRVRK